MATTDAAHQSARHSLLDELEQIDARDTLDQPDLERLLFLFRASDPGVYQPAAFSLGRRAARDDVVDRALYNYARSRSIDPDRPLQLNGQRSTRRVLLARTSTWVHAPAEERGPPPISAGSVGQGRPENAADAAVLLQVVAELLATRAVDGLAEAALGLLEDLPDHRAGRMVWRRWTELLFAIRGHGIPMHVPSCTAAWRDALDRLVVSSGDDSPVADGTRRLLCLDELFHVAGRHPDALQELSSAWPQSVTEADRRWCRLRFATWCRRHFPNRNPLLTVEPREYGGLARRAAELERACQERPGHIGASPVEAHGQVLLDALADMLTQPANWHRQPARERALALFLITDLDRAIALEPNRLAALPGVRINNSGLTVPWVLRVADWEAIAADKLLDSRVLHGIADLGLQEQLVQRHRGGDGELADVLENRFRSFMGTPGWDARRFLLRIHARQPSPQLFRRMATVASDRPYADSNGEPIPLREWCQGLAEETVDAPRPGLDSPDGHRKAVITGLRALASDPGAPAGGIRTLLSLTGRAGTTIGAPPGTVVGLLRYLGAPAGADGLPENAMDDAQGELLTLSELLEAGAWREPHRSREAAASLDHRLATLEELLSPLLPPSEATLLRNACDALRRYSRAWLEGLDAVAQATQHTDDTPEEWSAALASIPSEIPVSLRPPLLLEIWNSLHTDTRRPILLLRWATEGLDHHSLPEVIDALALRWRGQLERAMTSGSTADVHMLMRDPLFAPLRERINDPDLGRQLRQWHFDRLQPLRGVASGHRVGGSANTLSGLAGFLGHFAAVWIGLLVGAILMLDFGDAWREMAAGGDTQGIAITFLLGAGGTAAYLMANLRGKVRRGPEEAALSFWLAQLGRVTVFLSLCLVYTLLVTGGLWLLLSGTDEVVHGTMALGHIAVWAGFALFAGTFFGLVAKDI